MKNFKDIDIVDCLKIILTETTKENLTDFMFDIMRIFNEAQKAKDDGQTRHMLWMAKQNGTWCFPEANVYIRDAPENKTWCGYPGEKEGISAFVVEVTGVRDNTAVGNVYELVYADHIRQVTEHLFTARSVDIELKSGEFMNMSIDDFNYYKLKLKYDSIAKLTYVLDDWQKCHNFLTEVRKLRKQLI